MGQYSGTNKREYGLSYPLLLIGIGLFAVVVSADFPEFVQRGERLPGPRFFPTILGVFLIGSGAAEFVLFLRQKRYLWNHVLTSFREAQGNLRTNWGSQTAVILLALLIVFMPLSELVGFIAGALLISLVLLLRLKVPLVRALWVSVILVISIWAIFAEAFNVPLAQGLVEALF